MSAPPVAHRRALEGPRERPRGRDAERANVGGQAGEPQRPRQVAEALEQRPLSGQTANSASSFRRSTRARDKRPGGPALGLWSLPPAAYGLLGTWTALGFMAGELPNSFIKRRLDIPPGGAAQVRRLRLVFFVADRLDSTVGMLLALALVVPVSLPLCLFVLLAGPSVHAAFSVALFLLRVKARAA